MCVRVGVCAHVCVCDLCLDAPLRVIGHQNAYVFGLRSAHVPLRSAPHKNLCAALRTYAPRQSPARVPLSRAPHVSAHQPAPHLLSVFSPPLRLLMFFQLFLGGRTLNTMPCMHACVSAPVHDARTLGNAGL